MATPEQLENLANRIDHEELWRRPGMERDQMTSEQRDRLDAGVNLRRYANARFLVAQELKKGAEYMRGFKLERCYMGTNQRGCGTGGWHGAINRFSDVQRKSGKDYTGWMYTAKMVSDEVPRMILLFEEERRGRLPVSYKMCGLDQRPATELQDNHLRCGLGRQCRECPYLSAIEAAENMTVEAKDEAKAWTCATHILLESKPNDHIEQFMRDKSDDAFDARLAESFGAE